MSSSPVVRVRAAVIRVADLVVVVPPLIAELIPPLPTDLEPILHLFVPLVLRGEEIVESGKRVKVGECLRMRERLKMSWWLSSARSQGLGHWREAR